MQINFYKKYKEEVTKDNLQTTIFSIFGDQYVRGSFIKKNGDLRKFEGRVIENTRTNKSICFQDFGNKGVIRSISTTSPHIILESDDYTFELEQ
tara:strand:- start:788 stop:1069 length:282 start_codon:yes stop_codon:yes gene_type:complete